MKGKLIRFISVSGLIYFAVLNPIAVKGSGVSNPTEKVILLTDRSLYIVEESISFTAAVLNQTDKNLISKVLYVELITVDGNRISAGKYQIEDQKACGSITIPSDMLTGIYYIKAYTRWMRNFSLSHYSFTPVKIVNPYRTEIQQSGRPFEEIINNQSYSSQSHYPGFQITPDAIRYSKRQKGKITISLMSNAQDIKWANLTVVPSASVYSTVPYNYNSSSNGGELIQFYPETHGISLSGRISEKDTELPKPYSQVNLSILGHAPDFIAIRTDSSGRFNFLLPQLFGKTDLYIGIEEKGNSIVKIDNDFCTREVQLPVIPFELNDEEKLVASSMISSIEVKSKFMNHKISSMATGSKSPSSSFYGTPDNVFYFEKYIDLLSVREYFHELIPNVSVRSKSGKSVFKIHSNHTEIQVYEPLVLIDLIAVDRVDRILSANPNLLSRIEIITKPYYKGDMIFGGIISFFSRKGDLAGIDLPSSDMFLELDFFTPSSCSKDRFEPLSSNLPDTRNTILWMTDLYLEKSKSVSLDFQTPDTPGEYTILLRGINSKGDILLQSTSFVVY